VIEREPIYLALFARLQAIPGLATVSRRVKHWDDVPSASQPALFQSQKSQTAQKQTGLPTRWTLPVEVYLYVRSPTTDAPAAHLNPLIDAVCGALAPDDITGQRCTLGGLVHDARIAGQIETDEGTLGDQAVAIVPIEILVTD
jgi:hypothetical protein